MSTARPVLGLLHTSAVHVAAFDALAAEEAAGIELRHLVREDLLARARELGPDRVAGDVAAAVTALDADLVLCTCSTIGGVAERDGGSSVLRVDRPMAAEAVALTAGGSASIVVLAALASTRQPTLDLVADEAARAGVETSLRASVVDGAWERFETGDLAGYHALVATAVDRAADQGAGVVVLAQASMAPAAALAQTEVPVLSSPRVGLRAAARRLSRPGRRPS